MQCVTELQLIEIDIKNKKLIGSIDIKLTKRASKRYGCCKQENLDKKYQIVFPFTITMGQNSKNMLVTLIKNQDIILPQKEIYKKTIKPVIQSIKKRITTNTKLYVKTVGKLFIEKGLIQILQKNIDVENVKEN